ncbi:hypothetical protein NUM3379_03550 [Kineococcus sp. NUM-3379]
MTTSTVPAGRASAAGTASPLLRPLLCADAAVTGLNAAAYLAAAPLLAGVLGLPGGALRAAGAFLLTYALAVLYLGTRARPPRGAVVVVVAVNALWALGSVFLAVTGWHEPTGAGTAWVLAQAAVVATFAVAQAGALRRG